MQFSHGGDRRGDECSLAEWPATQFPPGASVGPDFLPVVPTAQDDVSSDPKHVQRGTDLGIVLAPVVDIHLEERFLVCLQLCSFDHLKQYPLVVSHENMAGLVHLHQCVLFSISSSL